MKASQLRGFRVEYFGGISPTRDSDVDVDGLSEISSEIRKVVFCQESHCDESEEFDSLDSVATHLIGFGL